MKKIAQLYPTEESMNILRIIRKLQNVSRDQIISKAEVFGIEEKDTEEVLETLEFDDLVDHSGDIYYTTSKGTILANKFSILPYI